MITNTFCTHFAKQSGARNIFRRNVRQLLEYEIFTHVRWMVRIREYQ
jgi:hypothetical protein